MANTLAAIVPKLLARGLVVLRETAVMPRLVNSDYSTEAAKFGATIDVPIPTATTASVVTPSNTPPSPTDLTPTTVQIALDQWYHSDFHLSDKEMMEIDRNQSFMPMQAGEAVRSIANQINLSILSDYKRIYGWATASIPATTPFAAAANIDDATTLRKALNQQLAPKANRRVILDWDAEANAIALDPFRDVSASSDRGVIIEGEIGRKFGMDWFADDQILSHTTPDIGAGAMTVNGAHAAGVTTLSISKAAGANFVAVAGDIISIAGDVPGAGTAYVIDAPVTIVAASDTAVTIFPALRTAFSGAEAITVDSHPAAAGAAQTHVLNLGFHRDAFALAMRPLQANTDVLIAGGTIMSMQDPVTGLILRLEVSRQYKQVVWDFDALWGTKLVRPALAARLFG